MTDIRNKHTSKPRVLFWTFRASNWTQETIDIIAQHVKFGTIDYVIYGKEHRHERPQELVPGIKNQYGEEAGWVPHLQGYLQLHVAKEATAVRKLIPGAHFEIAGGSREQNVSYCSKGDVLTKEQYPSLADDDCRVINGADVTELGTPRRERDTSAGPSAMNSITHEARSEIVAQGHQTQKDKLNNLLTQHPSYEQAVLNSKTLSVLSKHRTLAMDFYRIKRQQEARNMNTKDRPCFILWLCGPSGRGKSQLAWDIARRLGLCNVWQCTDTLKWLDNYIDQFALMIEEMRYDTTKLNNLLQLTDKHPLNRQAKGMYGGVDLIHQIVIITSPMTPQEVFSYRDKYDKGEVHQNDHIGQLIRRISCIRQWKEPEPRLGLLGRNEFLPCGPNYMYNTTGEQAFNEFMNRLWPEGYRHHHDGHQRQLNEAQLEQFKAEQFPNDAAQASSSEEYEYSDQPMQILDEDE